jgi:carboxyl-terminal processing protease
MNSFRGKAGQQAVVEIRREGPDAAPRRLLVQVAKLNGRMMFEAAMRASVNVIEAGDTKIGYVHIWSYAGRRYHDLLEELLLWGDLRACDALILDLRDGWGGASLEYVNLFRRPIVEVSSTARTGAPVNFSGVWGKPVTLLVNGGSTSGKELFAYAFRKLKLGEIVGTTTAGAVVAGRCILLRNGDALYVAVADLSVDGQRLEGNGVRPTVEVSRPLPYVAGKDPQLERAIELLTD